MSGADNERSEPPKNLRGTVVRGIFLSGGGYVLTQVLTLGFYLVLARLATPEDFGELAAGTLLIGIGLLFTESGMLAAVVQRRDRVEAAAATAVISTFAAGVGFTLIALALAPLVGTFFDSGRVTEVAAACSALLLLRTVPVVPNALLQRRFSFVRRTIVEPLSVIAFGTTAIIATAEGLGVWGLVLGQYASAAADAVLSWGLARWRPRLQLASFSLWRELIAYGRSVFGATAIHRVFLQVPVALIGRYVGEAPLGQYRYANRLAGTPYAVILAGGSFVLFPALARIADDPVRLRSAVLRSLRWMAVIGVPAGMLLLPFGEPLAVLVFGSVWREAGEATMALAVFPAAGALFTVASETFTANGRPELLLRMHGLELALGAAAMAALIGWGLVGVSAGVSIGTALAAAYALHLVSRVVGIPGREILRAIVPPVAAALVMAAVALPLEHFLDAAGREVWPGLALLGAEIACAIAVYGLALQVLSPGWLGELREIVRSSRRTSDAGGPIADPAAEENLEDALER